LGILDFNPIQYHTPLYQSLAAHGRVNLDVLFLSDHGYRPALDSEFGISVAWDIDLLSGYAHDFMPNRNLLTSAATQIFTLNKWIVAHDVVVIHGYSNFWMLLAAALCRIHSIPYLLRGDSAPQGQSTGLNRRLRDITARVVVSASACGLAIGQLNESFYRKYRAPRIIFAPYSVDDERFARTPVTTRSDLLSRWGLDNSRPVILFCGKLYPGKRPFDLVKATKDLPVKVNTIFVGDGVLADEIRGSLKPGEGVATGFVNQSELSAYYHAADILVLPSEVEKWGLVINEAMAAGALPVVSDRVGAAPDLVAGVGEVYPCADVRKLTDSLMRAMARIQDPQTRAQVRSHVSRYSLMETVAGFERAALTVVHQ
jgi:glycosyltransferase involved in cell wall biosynthesis